MRNVLILLVLSFVLFGCSGDGKVTFILEGGNDFFHKNNDPRQNMDWYVSRKTESSKFAGMGGK